MVSGSSEGIMKLLMQSKKTLPENAPWFHEDVLAKRDKIYRQAAEEEMKETDKYDNGSDEFRQMHAIIHELEGLVDEGYEISI